MNEELFRRLQAGLPPFAGTTWHSPEWLPLPVLRDVLAGCVGVLERRFAAEPLFRLCDWHEHDGVLLPSVPSSWEELRAVVSSPAALHRASAGDTYVRTAFYPAGFRFYLRYHVPEPSEQPEPQPLPSAPTGDPSFRGLFDVSCDDAVGAEVEAAIKNAFGAAWCTERAQPFFLARGA